MDLQITRYNTMATKLTDARPGVLVYAHARRADATKLLGEVREMLEYNGTTQQGGENTDST